MTQERIGLDAVVDYLAVRLPRAEPAGSRDAPASVRVGAATRPVSLHARSGGPNG